MAEDNLDARSDPLSKASAGLYALGVGPTARMDTLEMFGNLLDRADGRGRVSFGSSLSDAEERLGIVAATEAYDRLSSLGVIRRTAGGWVIPGFADHVGPAGAAAASLAVLRRHIQAQASSANDPVRRANDAVVVPMARRSRQASNARLAVAGLAAAAAALLGVSQLAASSSHSTRQTALASQGTSLDRPVARGAAGPGSKAGVRDVGPTPTNALSGTAGDGGGTGLAGTGASTGLICAVVAPISTITSVETVAVGAAGAGPSEMLWTAVVTGTLTNSEAFPVEVSGLTVAAAMPDGSVAQGDGTLGHPHVLGGATVPFNAVVTLGPSPTAPVSAAVRTVQARRTGC